MRVFCALNGALTVSIAYWTLRSSGHSVAAGVVAALMVCYKNGLITNNRHILLDPILLSFTAATTVTWINFHNQQHRDECVAQTSQDESIVLQAIAGFVCSSNEKPYGSNIDLIATTRLDGKPYGLSSNE
ncbi:Dolichyl-phosphate-mannose-protein mannosyltransferase-domain-containing protein [Circinella umbellata]|nr:Dolichyl-phosphate-mannose-protein mannosyltransferase-domain-containing protein [Circinella umbellata]